jgi:DNA gyrase subunit A
VVGMICVSRDDKSKTVLVVSEKGFGKRTRLIDEDGVDVYRITNRGGKGVKTINVTEKTGRLVGIMDVSEEEDLIITCQSGITLRTPIASIKTAGRNTQGVTLIRVDAEDAIAAISKIEEQEEEVVITEETDVTEASTTITDAITQTNSEEQNPNTSSTDEPTDNNENNN